MAAFDTTRTAQGAIGGGLSNFFFTMAERFVLWNEVRATRKALSRLSNRELEDIGLTRGDIDSIASRLR